MVSAEFTPFAKTGGLADVSSALSAYLHDAGHDVLAIMPRYPRVDEVGSEIVPVDGLQNLEIRIGPHHVHYSIDRTILPDRELPVHLVRCPALFGRPGIYTQDADEHLRFIVLSRVAIELCQHLGFAPDIFHCNDWHTALIPLYLKAAYGWDRLFDKTRSVFTIHNNGYQGVFGAGVLPDLGLQGTEHHLHQGDLEHGHINFLKTGMLYADLVTTVSPTYAREIQTPEYGVGLDELLRARRHTVAGILNGVDYQEWNPATDPLIPANYSPGDMRGKAECKRVLQEKLGLEVQAGRPLVGIVSRLVAQKGLDLVERVIPHLLAQRDFGMAILGSGEPRYEQFFHWLQQRFPGRVCFYRGYNTPLAHQIEAGADLFLMPSLYEPCGLNQMYSLKYGTVPVVRETGGLADSVVQIDAGNSSGTGVLFRDYDASGLAWAVNRGLDLYAKPKLWPKLVANGMAQDFSWERQGAIYVDHYHRLSGQA